MTIQKKSLINSLNTTKKALVASTPEVSKTATGPKLGSRGPKLGSRGPKLGSRGPKLGSRGPKLGSRGPKLAAMY